MRSLTTSLAAMLCAVSLAACSLVTTPIKVAGSVVEHAIDAVSPLDDEKVNVNTTTDSRTAAPRGWFCPKCGQACGVDARYCSACGTERP
jgi:hypothetical protein